MLKSFARLLSVMVAFISIQSLATEIPKSLEEWKPWVLEKHPELNCPFLFNNNIRQCIWHSNLTIEANDKGATFSQQVEVYKSEWIALPGNATYWPQNINDNNNNRISIRDNNNTPEVFLTSGIHQLNGDIRWSEMPRTLQVPVQSGIIQLNLNGKNVATPALENGNQLWLTASSNKTATTHQDAFNLRVFRKIEDAIPLRITTQLQLDVSGKEREIQLGQLLLSGFTPTEFSSGLPARFEKDGSVRIQVKPGSWELTLTSQSATPINDLSFKTTSELWPDEEIWVFVAARKIRSVQISGVQTIDPQQTDLPDDWKSLPAYLVTPASHFKIEELQRGESTDIGNELNINRTAWLSFDGSHFTVSDNISGTTHHSRLETIAPLELTNAAIGNEPQLITHLANNKNTGVEIRNHSINITGISQLLRNLTIPVTGWNEEFKSVATNIHLPPGWSLLTATGATSELGSWISKWTLWDMFIILIIVVAITRLTQLRYGLLATAVLLLIYHRTGAPVLLWLNLIIAIALSTYVSGKFKTIIVRYSYTSFLILALTVLPFAVREARAIINPELETENVFDIDFLSPFMSSSNKKQAPYAMAAAPAPVAQAKISREETLVDAITADDIGQLPDQNVSESLSRISATPIRKRYDPSQKTQTGLAVPDWHLNTVHLIWNGPIKANETTQLILISPLFNRLGSLLSVILPLLLSYILLRHFLQITATKVNLPSFIKTSVASTPSLLIFVSALLFPSDHARADVVIDQNILAELETRLTQVPTCLPNCAAIEATALVVNHDQLSIDIIAHANDLISLPLPADRAQWWPAQVSVDGKNATLVQTPNGKLLVSLAKGRHTINIKANIQGQDTLNLEFPVPLHNVNINATGWEVSGAPTTEQQSQSLQIQRVERDKTITNSEHLRPDPIAPFVIVRRELKLDVEWSITTIVTRVAPAFGAINLEIPVIDNEAPLTTQVNTNGKIAVHLEANQQEFSWTSSIKQITPLQLQAAEHAPWVEIWSLEASAMWHTDTKGIAPIQMDKEENLPIWQPWPSEVLSIAISRPEAAKGNYITIDSSQLNVTPGERSQDCTLQLNIRSNQGGQYNFKLPINAKLSSIEIDNAPLVIGSVNNELKIPLHPGKQNIHIRWSENNSIGLLTRSPEFSLDQGSSNQSIRIQLPYNRWPLLLGGPSMGPSILLWGMLLVVIIISVSLGRSQLTPLKSHQWILMSLGICTLNFFTFVVMAIWLIVLQQRGKLQTIATAFRFKLLQFGLFALSILALISLIYSIPQGLLGNPDMHILGNNSDSNYLNWYQDHSDSIFPQAWVISLPLWCYKVAILLWSLWVASSLLTWIRWGWQQLSHHALWYAPIEIVTHPKTTKTSKTDAEAKTVTEQTTSVNANENTNAAPID